MACTDTTEHKALPTSWCLCACGCVSEGNPRGLCTEVVKPNICRDIVNKHHFLLPPELPLCFVTALPAMVQLLSQALRGQEKGWKKKGVRWGEMELSSSAMEAAVSLPHQ